MIPGRHVVFWKQRDLKDFGASHYFLLADCGDCFSCHSVDLVEWMRTEISFVRSANKQQQTDWLFTEPIYLQWKKAKNNEQIITVLSVSELLTYTIVRFIEEIKYGLYTILDAFALVIMFNS